MLIRLCTNGDGVFWYKAPSKIEALNDYWEGTPDNQWNMIMGIETYRDEEEASSRIESDEKWGWGYDPEVLEGYKEPKPEPEPEPRLKPKAKGPDGDIPF